MERQQTEKTKEANTKQEQAQSKQFVGIHKARRCDFNGCDQNDIYVTCEMVGVHRVTGRFLAARKKYNRNKRRVQFTTAQYIIVPLLISEQNGTPNFTCVEKPKSDRDVCVWGQRPRPACHTAPPHENGRHRRTHFADKQANRQNRSKSTRQPNDTPEYTTICGCG